MIPNAFCIRGCLFVWILKCQVQLHDVSARGSYGHGPCAIFFIEKIIDHELEGDFIRDFYSSSKIDNTIICVLLLPLRVQRFSIDISK